MIIFFGPAGAGKSVQGQILAARHGWRWLSAGQLLRDTRDPEVLACLQTGNLVPAEIISRVMSQALKDAEDIDKLILDGFPREVEQAEWLMNNQGDYGRSIDLVVVLEVPRQEILQRLKLRGRADDTPESIDVRLGIYRKEMYPILDLFNDRNVPIVHINGVGTVGQVHDAIEAELVDREIVQETA
ncbi:oxidoreductase [Candidatus Saccharibacteria bacterium 32-50-10]|nr:MAG: oxidoreductase [Candidatus Saccharibacteria bacterium 32-50-10]